MNSDKSINMETGKYTINVYGQYMSFAQFSNRFSCKKREKFCSRQEIDDLVLLISEKTKQKVPDELYQYMYCLPYDGVEYNRISSHGYSMIRYSVEKFNSIKLRLIPLFGEGGEDIYVYDMNDGSILKMDMDVAASGKIYGKKALAIGGHPVILLTRDNLIFVAQKKGVSIRNFMGTCALFVPDVCAGPATHTAENRPEAEPSQ